MAQPDEPTHTFGSAEKNLEYEHECFGAMRDAALNSSWLADEKTLVIHLVALWGTYPDTTLVVDFFRVDRNERATWRLWHDEFAGTRPSGHPPDDAGEVVTHMMIRLMGG